VTWGVDPLEHVDRAVLQAGAVGETDVEVDRDVRTAYPLLLRRLDGSPDGDAVLLADLLRFCSKFESMAIVPVVPCLAI